MCYTRRKIQGGVGALRESDDTNFLEPNGQSRNLNVYGFGTKIIPISNPTTRILPRLINAQLHEAFMYLDRCMRRSLVSCMELKDQSNTIYVQQVSDSSHGPAIKFAIKLNQYITTNCIPAKTCRLVILPPVTCKCM